VSILDIACNYKPTIFSSTLTISLKASEIIFTEEDKAFVKIFVPYYQGRSDGGYIGIYTPSPPKKISPSKLFMG